MVEVTDTWDVVVIGGGPPGEKLAHYAIAGSDRTAVIVEKELVGGECSYWACMPSKAPLGPIEGHQNPRASPGGLSLKRRRSYTRTCVVAPEDRCVDAVGAGHVRKVPQDLVPPLWRALPSGPGTSTTS
jgi:dihydrolipoamide dehydrogenase